MLLRARLLAPALARARPALAGARPAALRPLCSVRWSKPPEKGSFNPLLGTEVPSTEQQQQQRDGEAPPPARAAGRARAERERPVGVASFRDLPVSPRKLTVVANLASGLYVREAMLQLEFCRKNIAVMVKNAVAAAVKNAEEEHGLDPSLLVVDSARVGRGSHLKRLDYKSKGRVGTRKFYFSHLRVTVKEVKPAALARTRHFNRWRDAARLLAIPWEERVAALPRYVRPDGYEPGVRRVEPVIAHDEAMKAFVSLPKRAEPKWRPPGGFIHTRSDSKRGRHK